MNSLAKHRAICHWMGAAALLSPFFAAADSHVQASATGAAQAIAHVQFKIIIPRVLYLGVDRGSDRGLDGQLVSVAGNSRNVALTATLGHSEEARGNRILSAAARKTIAEDAACTPQSGLARIAGIADRLVCTASMP